MVDRIGEFLPDARDALDLRLTAEAALGTDLARDPRHLRGEHRQLLDHRIDELRRAQEFTLEGATIDLQFHRLAQIALGDGADGAGDLGGRAHQIIDERVQGIDLSGPAADGARYGHALLEAAIAADRLAQARGLAGQTLLVTHRLVEGLGQAAIEVHPVTGQAHRKISIAKRRHGGQQLARARFGRSAGRPQCADLMIKKG